MRIGGGVEGDASRGGGWNAFLVRAERRKRGEGLHMGVRALSCLTSSGPTSAPHASTTRRASASSLPDTASCSSVAPSCGGGGGGVRATSSRGEGSLMRGG